MVSTYYFVPQTETTCLVNTLALTFCNFLQAQQIRKLPGVQVVKLEQLRYNTSLCKTVSSIFKSYMLLHHAEAVLGVEQIQIKVNNKIIRKKDA